VVKLINKDFNVALQTSKTVSKHHPSNFQKKVLHDFDSRMAELENKLNRSVPNQKLKKAQ